MVSVELATYLLQEHLLRPDQLDDLLQLQVVAGGALDTHILEQRLLGERALIAAKAEAYRLPPISREDIDRIPARIPEVFPRAFAETYRFVPYRLVERNLGVVVSEIPDPAVVKKLEQRLRIHIAPAMTTEARVYYAMQRLYGADVPPRLAELLARLDGQPEPSSPTASEPPPVLPEAPPQEPFDLDTALRRLQLARDRDHLVDVVLNFAVQNFQFAALFIAHDDHLMGYRGRGDASAVARIGRVFVPLDGPSMWQTVAETRAHYLGQVPSAVLNQRVLGDMGRAPPKTVFLAPLVIADKVSGVLYADNGKRGVASKKVADIMLLMTRLGPHFQRLIQRRKAEVKAAMGKLTDAAVQAARPSPEEAPPQEENIVIDSEPTTALPELAEPTAQMKALLAQRMLNVLKAAQEEDGNDDDEKEGEETIEGISADALLGKEAPRPERAPEPTPPPPQHTEKIFQDVTAASSVASWQEGLNETIASGRQAGDVPEEGVAPMEVDWEDVIVEARAAPAPLTALDDVNVLLDALDAPDAAIAARAAESLWVKRADLPHLLVDRFPGRLSVDPFAATSANLPSVAEMSQVLRLLVALGANGVPAVLPHLESRFPVYRLLATLYFGQVVSGKAFARLVRRLFDEEPRVREAAADILRGYRNLEGYDEGVGKVRERLHDPESEAQVRAIEILGRLRDLKSISGLITLVSHKKPEVANSALGALMRLTAQDFGHNPKRWTEWWVAASDQPREQWLIEGLKKKEPILRVIADEELRRLSGLTFRFDQSAERREQEASIRGWESWWASEERYRRLKK